MDLHKRIADAMFRNAIADPNPQGPPGMDLYPDLEVDMFAASNDPEKHQFEVTFQDVRDGRYYDVVVTVAEPTEARLGE